MSLISQRHNTDSLNLTGSHNQVHIVGRDYTTITHHHDTSQETVLAALKPVDRSAYYVTPWKGNMQGLGDDMNHTYVWDATRLMQANNVQGQARDFTLSYLTP
jgi:hypothetical protein